MEIAGPRAASGRRVGALFLVVASLTMASDTGLSASLSFPEVLLDDRSFAASLVASGTVALVLSLIGLLGCGVLLAILSRSIAPLLPEDSRRPVLLIGWTAGLCWGTSAALGLILVPLLADDVATGVPFVPFLSGAAFVGAALAAPLLLAAWTVTLARQFPRARVVGLLGALGLLLVCARSLMWAVNTLLPADEGFYLVSAILTVLALLGPPVWFCWLIRMGLLVSRSGEVRGPSRHAVLAASKRLGVGLLGVVFMVVYAGVAVIGAPTPRSDAGPSVPSESGAVLYVVVLAFQGAFAGPSSYPQILAQRRAVSSERLTVPPDASLENVDAGGVPADYVCANGVSRDRAVLYLHGGNFVMPLSNNHRRFAATISGQTGACVLLPDYRLAPEHPFPTAVRDSVSAYRWLRRQGIAASRITVLGDSSGGTFALATALSLRDSGDALPAALVALSPGTDLTLTGTTHRTKAASDPLLSRDDVIFSVRSYTGKGAADPGDPLVSPLFADLDGLPPTLLMAGSQEVLLSDSTRMADRLRAAGVPVQLEIGRGMMHDWPLVADGTPEAGLAVQHIATFISRHMVG